MLTLFWDERGVNLEHYIPRGDTVTSAMYTDLLKNHLLPAIKSKRRGLLITGVLLQHNNPRPHTARSTVAAIQDLSFECLPHPPYSPDLASSAFHVFGSLKRKMEGKPFKSDEEVQRAVRCTVSQNTLFLEAFLHYRSDGTLVWNAMETT